jgi:acyl-CoA reductase-like NAD-dependent aldehyde dehydrogenase
LKLAELGAQFFPPDILQILSGDDSLNPFLTEHPDVDTVRFTGFIPVRRKIMETCSKTPKRFTLELGGNDAAIVCADVDPVAVASKIGVVAFAKSWQIFIAIKRVYVHGSVCGAMLTTLVGFTRSLKVGVSDNASMGLLASEPQYGRVKCVLADINRSNLTVGTGSTEHLLDNKGVFIRLTIMYNPLDDALIVAKEQFGK